MRRSTPSLSALRAFESAARLASFTRAAEELGVTQGAISRLVRGLEVELGVVLFRRTSLGVSPTPDGKGYVAAIARSLRELEAATSMMRAKHDRAELSIAAPPTFAARWLVPRLAEFAARHPGTTVNLSVEADPSEPGTRPLDGQIFYTAIPPRGAELLMDGWLIPVCSPDLARRFGTGRGLNGLGRVTLLELGPPGDWAAFLALHQPGRPGPAAAQAYVYFDAGIQAAISGRGVLLAPAFLVAREIEAGSLVAPFSESIVRPASYVFCPAPRRRAEGATRSFLTWLQAALRRSAVECRALLRAR